MKTNKMYIYEGRISAQKQLKLSGSMSRIRKLEMCQDGAGMVQTRMNASKPMVDGAKKNICWRLFC